MRRLTATALALGAALAAPAQAAERPPEVPNAAAAIVVDGRDGEVMFARRPYGRRAIASTTKLMTALLTIERAKPRQVFPAADYDALPVESQIGLRAGERMRVSDLLEALLLESANDAAVTLAEGVSGSTDAFVAQMNERAEELRLEGTHYANPIGLDDRGNYSNAADLAALTRVLLAKPRFARIVDMPSAQLESGARPRAVANRNNLIAAYPWVSGVKTGYTLQAGNVLVGSAEGRGGARVISVVMGEPSEAGRDADTLALLKWGLDRFHRVRVVAKDRRLARASVKYRDEPVALLAARPLTVTLRHGQEVRRELSTRGELEGPLPAGTRAGSVNVVVDGNSVGRVALVTARELPEVGTAKIVLEELGLPLTTAILLAILLLAVVAVQRVRGRPSRR